MTHSSGAATLTMIEDASAWGDGREASEARPMPTLWRATRSYVAARRNAGEHNRLTATGVAGTLARFAIAVGPELDVTQLRARHIDKWLATRAHLAPGSLRVELSKVRSFTRWCVRRGWLRADPCAEIKGPTAPRAVPRHLQDGAIARALDAADLRGRLIIVLMAQLGLRRGEVAGLQHGDIDSATVRVHGRGGHERMLPLTDEVRMAIDAYLAVYPANNGPLIRSYMYPNRGVSAQTVGNIVADVFRAAGVKRGPRDGVSAHPIRHTAANDLLDRGVDIRLVQQTLGHAKLSTTAIYLQRRAALGALRDALEGRRYGDGEARP